MKSRRSHEEQVSYLSRFSADENEGENSSNTSDGAVGPRRTFRKSHQQASGFLCLRKVENSTIHGSACSASSFQTFGTCSRFGAAAMIFIGNL